MTEKKIAFRTEIAWYRVADNPPPLPAPAGQCQQYLVCNEKGPARLASFSSGGYWCRPGGGGMPDAPDYWAELPCGPSGPELPLVFQNQK